MACFAFTRRCLHESERLAGTGTPDDEHGVATARLPPPELPREEPIFAASLAATETPAHVFADTDALAPAVEFVPDYDMPENQVDVIVS